MALQNEVKRYAQMPEAERVAMGARGESWLLGNRQFPKLAENTGNHA